MSKVTFGYDVNALNEIIALNPNWTPVSESGSGVKPSQNQILGRPVWDFISGEETRHLYEILFEKVRTREKAVDVPIRCDSPSQRRLMSLEILPLGKGALRLQGKMLRSESRPPIRLLDQEALRSEDSLTVCSWCKCIRRSPDRWVEVEVASKELGLFQATALPFLSHGICPNCEKQIENF